MHCSEDSDANAAAMARAYTIARDSADLRALWVADRGTRRPHQDRADQYDALLETSRYLSHLTLWLLQQRREYDAVGAAVARLQPALRELAQVTPAVLEGLDRERYLAALPPLRRPGISAAPGRAAWRRWSRCAWRPIW